MTTSLVTATYSHAATANFQAWVNEIYTALVTTCGLTNTVDSGQMAVPCTSALPGTNTSAGYYMFNFNDTLQATAPVFIKMEFGTGTSAAAPSILVTVGTGTNGAGTVTGTVLFRVQATTNSTISNPGVTSYNSRYCYNATQGFLGLVWKTGSTTSLGNIGMGAIFILRSNSVSGAPTADSVLLITNASSATTGSTGSGGNAQIINYNIPTAYQGGSFPLTTQTSWCPSLPYGTQQSVVGTTGQVFPVWNYQGTATQVGFSITNLLAICILAEIPTGTTASINIIGSSPLTYISTGNPLGTSLGNAGSTTFGLLMLWQ